MFTLKDAMAADIHSTFFNTNEFAIEAIINGVPVPIVPDENALAKYNLKAEGEGLARGELLFYAPVSDFLDEPFIGMEIPVDGRSCSVLDFKEDAGVYEIVLEGYRS
ncbi:hypothetical protein K7T73_12960 [Bacillus badius]|uniref:hypothetical protein n=1 Tax=Bacillus badius TaxID=1455 RepID=UPI001CBABD11|nr:hypothetical protein [Bacillus badius]UAT29510.1 hypothetical protein K7T73_12960 [Bacillus badius]